MTITLQFQMFTQEDMHPQLWMKTAAHPSVEPDSTDPLQTCSWGSWDTQRTHASPPPGTAWDWADQWRHHHIIRRKLKNDHFCHVRGVRRDYGACVIPDALFMAGVFCAYKCHMDVSSAQRLRHRDLLHTLLIFKSPPTQTKHAATSERFKFIFNKRNAYYIYIILYIMYLLKKHDYYILREKYRASRYIEIIVKNIY